MASSFYTQLPVIINLIIKLQPKKLLDIGKGFGKYGFLIHEYVGIRPTQKINPAQSLKEQSQLLIDAVEADPDLMLPHLDQLYNKVYFGDILKIYRELPEYDLVLMIDIIEHINKEEAIHLVKHLLSRSNNIIIATPIDFFEQELYQSEFERHVSHWTRDDFKNLGFLDLQFFEEGAVYLLSKEKIDIRGFGNTWIKKIRRIARAIKNEL
jgi:hypothetical protein